MKKWMFYGLYIFCVLLLTGCGSDKNVSIKTQTMTNSVNSVINDQINKESSAESKENTKSTFPDNNVRNTQKAVEDVDYDLSEMSSDMVYATVYQMMYEPQAYVGKKVRISGTFNATYYNPTNQYYFNCIIQDATACCAQGIEFVWDNGTHIYPDEYPENGQEIMVEGIFETYEENGSFYCRLSNATLRANS